MNAIVSVAKPVRVTSQDVLSLLGDHGAIFSKGDDGGIGFLRKRLNGDQRDCAVTLISAFLSDKITGNQLLTLLGRLPMQSKSKGLQPAMRGMSAEQISAAKALSVELGLPLYMQNPGRGIRVKISATPIVEETPTIAVEPITVKRGKKKS